MIYLSTRLESTVPTPKTVVAYNAGMRLAARTQCIRIHMEYSYESIPKYPRKLGSLRKAESVADRGVEEKTELGFDIWLQVLLRARKREHNPGAILFIPDPGFPVLPSPRPPSPLLSPGSLSPVGSSTPVTSRRSRETVDARVKTYEHICTASITRADETWHGRYGSAMKMRWQNGGSGIPRKVVRGLMSRVKLDVSAERKQCSRDGTLALW